MILVDTSIWVDHLRNGNRELTLLRQKALWLATGRNGVLGFAGFRKDAPRLATGCFTALLEEGEAAIHPFVIGELACGNIRNRREIIALLQELPSVPTIDQIEFMAFIERYHLSGLGLGFVDVHLLASSRLSGIPLWTSDKSLSHAAYKLRLSK